MWLIKSEEDTDLQYGKLPNDRTLEELINSSIIIVDKHSGPTSHQVTAWIRDIFNVKNCGHSGTLDPAVTGVLPVALGNATKAMPVLTGIDKEYIGVMHLHKEVPENILRNVISEKFIGKIKQRPPVKSAVARVEREREIYFFDILEIVGKDILFKVGCEAGTYIRKLCHDIGQALKVGAHMSELRRTKVGDFTEGKSHSLVEIRDAYEFWKGNNDEANLRKILIPVEYATMHVKRVFVKDSAVDALCNGSPLYPKGITRIQKDIIRGETIAIMTLKEELIALGISKMTSEEMLNRKTGTAVRIDRVLMPRGTYQKWEKA
ncbi:MAG: RNA-guided pseudouridylation complex pseudouridine synthase subunit Cbf5 [Candidatus Aenigmarchaeota archaeon]|nr:RNA-guided pseudouridylation complex pseudouridine synthase subunit Cbf5 [Candidatus Aenigmarchaeota archaeon]